MNNMKISTLIVLFCFVFALVKAQNPIIKHIFTADPAPLV